MSRFNESHGGPLAGHAARFKAKVQRSSTDREGHAEDVPSQMHGAFSIENIIDGEEHYLDADAMDAAERVIDAAVRVEQGNRRALDVSQLQVVLMDCVALRNQLGEARRIAQNAKIALGNLPRGSRIVAVLLFLAWIGCMVGEFGITIGPLPWAYGITGGWLRYAIAAIPVFFLLILEPIFKRLVEDPWLRLRKGAVSGRGNRLAIGAYLVAFILAVGAMNLYTIVQIAKIREQAAIFQASPIVSDVFDATETTLSGAEGGADDATMDPAQLRKTVVSMSICVAVDGALLMLFAFRELADSRYRRKRERESAECERMVQLAESAFRTASADFTSRNATAASSGERCADAAELAAEMAKLKLKVAQLRHVQNAGAAGNVKEILAGRLGPRRLASVKKFDQQSRPGAQASVVVQPGTDAEPKKAAEGAA